jgi:hypothetical protein
MLIQNQKYLHKNKIYTLFLNYYLSIFSPWLNNYFKKMLIHVNENIENFWKKFDFRNQINYINYLKINFINITYPVEPDT